MSAAYYAAHVHGPTVIVQSGPHDSHAAAMQTHANALGLQTGSDSGYWQRRVLLDVGSLDLADEADLTRVLLTDPTLAALFKLGARAGGADAWARAEIDRQNRAAAEVENPS